MVDIGNLSPYVPGMASDIHVWLSDDEAKILKRLAKREDRSVTNTARMLIRRALESEVKTKPQPDADAQS